MSISYKIGSKQDISDDILESTIEEIKIIDRTLFMTPQAKMRMFQVYFRGLKDGLRILSGNVVNQEDPLIKMIDDNIISGIISGKLSDKDAWLAISALEA